MIIAAALVMAALAQPATAQRQVSSKDCSVPNAAAAEKTSPRAVKPAAKVAPEPNSQARVINFGDDRDPEFEQFILTSEPALPAGAEKRLSLVADVVTRTGSDTAETVTFPEPTFTPVYVSGNRKRLRFGVCLTPPSSLPAGKYTGLVMVDAPPGIEGTSVSVTANAKDGNGFKLGAIATLVVAFLVLLYKGAADKRASRMEAAKSGDDAAKAKAADWKEAFRAQVGDFGWWAATGAALAVTFIALYGLWEKNPAWGDSGLVSSWAALIAAGLAAVGAKTIVTPSGSK